MEAMILSLCGSQKSFFRRVAQAISPPSLPSPTLCLRLLGQILRVQPGPPWATLDLAPNQRMEVFCVIQKHPLEWGGTFKEPKTMPKCISLLSFPFLSFPFLSIPFLSFPFLSFPFLSFPFLFREKLDKIREALTV